MVARTPLVLGSDGLLQALQSGDNVASAIGFLQSLAANGYQKLPSGLIINWGQLTPSGGTATATFALAYQTACFVAIGTSLQSGTANGTALAVSTLTQTLTGATFAARSVTGLAAATASTAPVLYVSLGA